MPAVVITIQHLTPISRVRVLAES